jgi:hypothetical protein
VSAVENKFTPSLTLFLELGCNAPWGCDDFKSKKAALA